VVRTSQSLRVLGPSDVAAGLEVIGTDPVVNVFADYRTRITQLDPRWLGGEMWGYFDGDRLASMCHVGANLVPVNATPEACDAFVDRAIRTGPHSSTIVGPYDAVASLWSGLEDHWPTPRDFRWDQPHLVATRVPTVPHDPLVRRTAKDEVDVLYPACVAMYTEEVGISPEQGLATAGMATVVDICLREIAPAVSLYVNGHNEPARAAYRRAGFEQTGTFATIMF
jgi:hypothetical protein